MSLVRSLGTVTVVGTTACALVVLPVGSVTLDTPVPASVTVDGTGATEAQASAARPGPRTAPADKPVSELLRDLRALHEKTEAASDAYKSTTAKLKKQRGRAGKAKSALTKARSQLAEGRDAAARLARQQYRQGGVGIPSDVQLLLSKHPQRALDHGHLLKRAAKNQAATVERLASGERRHRALTEKAHRELAKEQQLAERQRRQHRTVEERLNAVESMLATLSLDRLDELSSAESERVAGAQRQLMSAPAPGAARAPSRQGERALRFALDQVGKPYVWGAEGPGAFDCSGLTARAWKHAGRTLPRTSQAQWKKLKRVPLHELRPGDLVLYHRGATHVGLYAGEGRIVQAPRPRAKVTVSPLSANPLLGAVRPDPGARPLADYRPPRLPAGTGDDRARTDG